MGGRGRTEAKVEALRGALHPAISSALTVPQPSSETLPFPAQADEGPEMGT